MGGKTWSADEERIFWREIVPQSPQAVQPGDRVHSWERCATIMQEAMGEPRRRDYTRTMLYEHYYQNVKTGSHSPRARDYVRQHKREISAEVEREQTASAALSSSGTPETSEAPLQASYSDASSTLAAHTMAPSRGRKRPADPTGEHVPAKRQQLLPAEPHLRNALASDHQIGLASEQWLAQLPPRPRTRLPAGSSDARSNTSIENVRPVHERAQFTIPPSRDTSTAFDALLWASEVHSNGSSLTSAESRSQSRSQSRSESVSRATSLQDEAYGEGSGTGTVANAHPPRK